MARISWSAKIGSADIHIEALSTGDFKKSLENLGLDKTGLFVSPGAEEAKAVTVYVDTEGEGGRG